MARILKGSHSFTGTRRVHPLTEWPAFAFPAEDGTHLSTLEGWAAELASGGWLLHTEINVQRRELNPDMVTHLSTNRARRWLTLLIEANALTTTPDRQPCTIRGDHRSRRQYDNRWSVLRLGQISPLRNAQAPLMYATLCVCMGDVLQLNSTCQVCWEILGLYVYST